MVSSISKNKGWETVQCREGVTGTLHDQCPVLGQGASGLPGWDLLKQTGPTLRVKEADRPAHGCWSQPAWVQSLSQDPALSELTSLCLSPLTWM